MSIRFKLTNLLIVSTLMISHVYCRSNGAPFEACHSMRPKHGANKPQPESTNPYRLSVNLIPESNEKVVYIHLDSPDPRTNFRGFMVQARTVNASAIVDGTFVPYGKDSRTFRCKDREEKGDDTWTHANNALKSNASSFWFLGDQSIHELVFVATVAKDGKTFWMNIRSEIIKFEPIQSNEVNGELNQDDGEAAEGDNAELNEETPQDDQAINEQEQPVTEDGAGQEEDQTVNPDAELAIGEETPCEDENDCQPEENDINDTTTDKPASDQQPEPSNNVDRFASSAFSINQMSYTSLVTLIVSLFIYRTLI